MPGSRNIDGPTSRHRREGGAALVEVALSLPIFIALLGLLIDGSFYLFARETMGALVGEGVRAASIARDEPTADRQAVQAMFERSAGMPGVTVERVVVYEASELGAPPSAHCRDGRPSDRPGERCNVYSGSDLDRNSELRSCVEAAPWCPGDRSADQLIGVFVRVRYEPLTGLIPLHGVFEDHVVGPIEADVEQRGAP